MKKNCYAKFDETWYTHTLDNGLNLIFWHKPEFRQHGRLLRDALRRSGLPSDRQGRPSSDFPSGIAHFFWSMLFRVRRRAVMEDFSRMGANVNAFTSYNGNVLLLTSHGDLKEPLNLLIDFVQNSRITDESVEKEKASSIRS